MDMGCLVSRISITDDCVAAKVRMISDVAMGSSSSYGGVGRTAEI